MFVVGKDKRSALNRTSNCMAGLLVGPRSELPLIRSLSSYLAQPFDDRDLGDLNQRSLLDELPIRATLL